MEEEKVVVENEQPKEEPVKVPAEQPQENDQQPKNALMAFILSLVGFGCAFAPVVSIAAIILGAIASKMNKAAAGIIRKPHAIFQKISKPVAIVDIVFGIIMTVVYIIIFICNVVLVALGVIAAETGSI